MINRLNLIPMTRPQAALSVARAAVGFVAVLLVMFAAAHPAAAQDEGSGPSFLDPFPPGDVYNIMIVGDDYAEGLHAGMMEAFMGDGRVQIRPKATQMNGLMRPDFAEKLVAFGEDLKREPASIAIVMLGAWDRVSVRDPQGKRMTIGTPGWNKEYADRADRLLKQLKRANVPVFLAGLPGGPSAGANEDAQLMNDVLRERAYLNGSKYIDTFADFADENGGFSQWGPDISGKIVRLRRSDGVYFTPPGNRKLAHFVERELRRDLNQARANRAIPLAGSEEEQARINPDRAKLAPAAAEPGAKAAASAPAGARGSADAQPAGETAVAVGASDGEQKADNGKISLRSVNAAGREETVTVDIIRPAISAQVVQLVTRRESADRPSQMGATLTDHIPGGLTVMSSVTPDGGSGSGQNGPKLSAAQTPYFRVLFKGERLPAEAGRADDVSWPRPEPPAAAPPPAPGETGSTLKPTSDEGAPPSSKPRKSQKSQ